MDWRDNMCVRIHMHVLQPVLLPVSSWQRSNYAVNFRPAQHDFSIPAERDDLEGTCCYGRLEVPWRG